MRSREPLRQKRNLPERRQKDRRATRRRLHPSPVPVERRAGGDRRQWNRRGHLRRAADTLTAKKKIYARARRASKKK